MVEFDIYNELDLPFLFDKQLSLKENLMMNEEVSFDEDVATDEETCRCAKLVLENHLVSAIELEV